MLTKEDYQFEAPVFDDAVYQIQHFPEPLRAQGWPNVELWTPRKYSDAWRVCVPDHRLPAPLSHRESIDDFARPERRLPSALQDALPGCRTLADAGIRCNLHYRKWLKTIPPEILAEARRYGPHAYRVLKIFSVTHPAGYELSSTGGHLLILGLADRLRTSRFAMHAMPAMVGRPRRRIAEYLGYPGTKSAVKILAKVRLEDVLFQGRLHETLTELMTLPHSARHMQHLPELGGEVLEILSNPRLVASCGPGLLEATLAPTLMPFDIKGTLEDTVRMWRTVNGDRPVPRIHSEEQLYRLHNRMVEAFNARRRERRKFGKRANWTFPKPPIEGTDSIIALDTPKKLRQEGRECHHCVGSYAEIVARGGRYVYKVLSPERATLLIRKCASGQWKIGQVLAPHNKRVEQRTKRAIEAWLSGNADSSAA